RTDQNYYNFLYNAEPTARPLIDSWRDTTGSKAIGLLNQIQQDAQMMLNAYVNGTGIYSFQFQYWMGGLIMSRDALFLNGLQCCDSLPASYKPKLKPPAALFANILWDNDFVPMFTTAGVNLGTPNMPVQEQQYRDLYALMLPNVTAMAGLGAQAQTDMSAS